MISVIKSMFGARLRDLRPQAIRQLDEPSLASAIKAGNEALKRMANGLGSANMPAGDLCDVTFTDEWTSPIIHRLIPLPRRRERLSLRFAPQGIGPTDGTAPHRPPARLMLLDAPYAGFGHEYLPEVGWKTIYPAGAGAPLASARRYFGEVGGVSSSAGVVLAESLWFYISLPRALVRQAFAVSIGVVGTRAGLREAVYCSVQAGEPKPSIDQFLMWLDPETARPTHVQYTFRRMLASYAGCIEYQDWKEVEPGWWWPVRQLIGTHPGSGAAYHMMTIESIERSPNR